MISLRFFMVAGRPINDHAQDQHRDQHQHRNQHRHRHQYYSLEIVDDDNYDTAVIATMTTTIAIATATIVTTDIALTFADYVSVKNRDARRFEQLSEKTFVSSKKSSGAPAHLCH